MNDLTKVVYLLKVGKVFLQEHPSLHHWTEYAIQAKQFNTEIDAETCAVTVLCLCHEDFEIVPIRVVIIDSVSKYWDAVIERMGGANTGKR